jgi:hypothetical protein
VTASGSEFLRILSHRVQKQVRSGETRNVKNDQGVLRSTFQATEKSEQPTQPITRAVRLIDAFTANILRKLQAWEESRVAAGEPATR